jgi:hypothetical protein
VPKNIARGLAAVAAATALSVAGAAGVSASDAAARAALAVRVSAAGGSPAAAVPGARLWASRYNGSGNGPGNQDDHAQAVAVSPAGGMVFVTGFSQGPGAVTGDDYATVAYSAVTGTRRWVARYTWAGNGNDLARAIAVSPTGSKVFVTGSSQAGYATIAYNAATGARLWVSRYSPRANSSEDAASVAVSPDGSKVFVTGSSSVGSSAFDYATIAYNTATGTRLWAKRYNSHGSNYDLAHSVAVSPDGSSVFVTGTSAADTPAADYATIAYNAVTGVRRWISHYNGPGNNADNAASLAVSPDGGEALVTGSSRGATSGSDYATVAYDTATGRQLWVKRYNGPGNSNDSALWVAVSPSGSSVFVTGASAATTFGADYATVAYNTVTGKRLWASRFDSPGNTVATARSVAVSANGQEVFITGSTSNLTSADYLTVAYSTATGAQLWASRYNGPASHADNAYSIAVSPAGGKVFVTGASQGLKPPADYATVAYRG